MARLPLQGIRVVTNEMAYAIPYTTRIMASMGAEVIKVMPTRYVEAAVTAGPFPENQPGEEWWNQSLCQTNTNPGKLGLCRT